MAIIKVTTTGSGLTGSVGDLYYRIQNGKQVVCSKPSGYKLSQDERSVRNRFNMKHLSYISKKITKTPPFYDMWFVNEIKGSGPYHKFFSFNHPKDKYLEYSDLKLSPSAQINVEVQSFNMKSSPGNYSMNVVLKPLGELSGIDVVREPFIGAAGFVLAKAETKKHPLTVSPAHVNIKPVNLNESMKFTMNFDDNIKGSYTFLLVIMTFSSVKEFLRSSDTFCLEK